MLTLDVLGTSGGYTIGFFDPFCLSSGGMRSFGFKGIRDEYAFLFLLELVNGCFWESL